MTPGARAVPADRQQRRQAVDAARSWIVQAPAGSGKTELLIQRFLALLGRVDAPEAILAVTFTRKAAGEMRERITAALESAALGESARDANGAFTLELASGALDRDARQGWDIRNNPARLRVQTIDSFCASIAGRLPYLAGFGAMPRVTENAAALYREAARNTLRLLTGNDAWGEAMTKLALHLDNDLQRIQRMIEAMLPRRDQWLRHIGVGGDTETARRNLESELGRVLEDASQRMRRELPDGVEETIVAMIRFSRGLECARLETAEAWRAAAELLLTKAGAWRQVFNTPQGFPPHAHLERHRMQQLMERLQGEERFRAALKKARELPGSVFSERQWNALEALLVALPAAAAELKLVFRESGEVDFVEVAQAARAALGDPAAPADLALALGERIEHVLLDEFQDTSVSQIELIERLTAGWEDGDGRTLFLVGDPMQSIYRFREAEVGLFLRVRKLGLREDFRPGALTLTNNFRTRPEVLAWINGAFAQVFPGEEDVAQGAVPYTGSLAFREGSSAAGVEIHPFLDSQHEAAEAALVAELLQKLRSGTAAVLVRARHHAVAIVRELKRRGIRYRAVDLDPLAERPAVTDLLALTRALLHPGDRTAWLAVLRAPWCGASLEELLAIAESAGRGPLWPAIPETARYARLKEALGKALGRVRRVPLRECVEEAWGLLGGPEAMRGEAEYRDAVGFLELLDSIDQRNAGDLRVLEERVARLFAAPDASGGGTQDPRGRPVAEIMTIHKAKGLEFDTVIVPGLGYGPANEPKQLLRWGEVPLPDGNALLFAPVEATDDERDPIYQYLGQLDRSKTRHEVARLLYVAATRARERLHLCGHVEVKDGALRPPRAGSLLELLWPAVEGDFARALAAAPAAQGNFAFEPPRTIRRLDPDWRPAARGPSIAWRPETAVSDEEQVPFEWVGDTLRHAGTAVHECMERLARGVEGWDALRGGLKSRLESLGVAPAEIDRAAAIVERAVRGTLGDARGQWILKRREVEACEFAASVAIDGAVYGCVIDRTFVEDGIRWVIDYKTSDIAGGGLEAFLDNEVERYRARMERYRKLFEELEDRPVKVGLYFPLLGGWRSW